MTASPRPLGGLQVLLVEDQYLVAAEMRRLVRTLGGQPLGPFNGVAGASAALEGREPVDLALLDVNLDEERVYPLARTLQEQGTPIIFTTGYDHWAIDPEFGDTPIVSKPVNAAGLVAALARMGIEGRT